MTPTHDPNDDAQYHHGQFDDSHRRQQRRGEQHRSSDRRHVDQELSHQRGGGQPEYAPRSSHESVQPGGRQLGESPGSPPGQSRGRQTTSHGQGGDANQQRGAERQHPDAQPSHHGPDPRQSHRRGHEHQHRSGGPGGDRGQGDVPRSRQQAYDPGGQEYGGTQPRASQGAGNHQRGHEQQTSDQRRHEQRMEGQGNVPRGNVHHHEQHPAHIAEEGLSHSSPHDPGRRIDRRDQHSH